MGELRIRIKFGDHEFEAEGPADSVERRADAFHQMFAPPPAGPALIEASPMSPEEPPAELKASTTDPADAAVQVHEKSSTSEGTMIGADEKAAEPEVVTAPPPLQLTEITHNRQGILSLSVTTSVPDAVLVILLAQRHFRRNEAVSGIELMEGLRGSGIRIDRVDNLMTKLARQGMVIVMGEHRRRRYRLSVAGAAQAESVARRLCAELPAPLDIAAEQITDASERARHAKP